MRLMPQPRRLFASGLLVLCLLAGATTSPTFAGPHARNLPAVAASRAAGSLGPLINIPQTWNNCGPASVAEVLAYWGISRTQSEVQAVLRADGNPHGMAPYGVPAYARSLGLRALVAVGGSERLVKALVSNGFPVIVSQYVSLADHVGHYRPIQAYDDRQALFTSSDPYLGQGHTIGYAEFDAIWTSTNRRFLVLYPPTRQALLSRVLATSGWDRVRAFTHDLTRLHALLRGTLADTTGYGSPRGWYLSIAWDDLQIGRYSAARQALRAASLAGANPIQIGWVQGELPAH